MAAPASGHEDKRRDPETQDEEIHCLLWAHTGAPSVTIDRVCVCVSDCARQPGLCALQLVESNLRRAVQLYCTLISHTTKTTDGRHESRGSRLQCDVLVGSPGSWCSSGRSAPTQIIIILDKVTPAGRQRSIIHNISDKSSIFHVMSGCCVVDAGVAPTSR